MYYSEPFDLNSIYLWPPGYRRMGNRKEPQQIANFRHPFSFGSADRNRFLFSSHFKSLVNFIIFR